MTTPPSANHHFPLGWTAYLAWSSNSPEMEWRHMDAGQQARWRDAAIAAVAAGCASRTGTEHTAFGQAVYDDIQAGWAYIDSSSRAAGQPFDTQVWRMQALQYHLLSTLQALNPQRVRDEVLAEATRAALAAWEDIQHRDRLDQLERQSAPIEWNVAPPVARPGRQAPPA